MMTHWCILPSVLGFFLASVLDGLGRWEAKLRVWGRRLFIVGWISQTAYLFFWYREVGAPFVVTQGDSIFLISWVIATLYLILGRRERWQTLGTLFSAAVLVVMLLGIFYRGANYAAIYLWPHAWVVPVHLAAAMTAVAVFAVAMITGVLLVISDRQLKNHKPMRFRLPSLANLESVLSALVSAGWVLLTVVLATGVVMMASHGSIDLGGHWWLAVTAWLIYAVVLHSRLWQGARGRKGMLLSLVGFLAILLTFLEAHSK
ncbi:MAG: hypothetical protein COV45_07335 [Deltaproteobacteria bacterium CG11_big_fil_rev_8_21_14_0_20_47_16]|nr:MAG: hypothetical protein COV45_07335 [Deltaproteobacteria bacterium CG11_big_fil_rev_8_21_14_0_20_47_16]